MKARNFLGSYLQKEDITEPVIATISSAKEESLDENERPKLVLYFAEFEKGLVCNVTNITMLIDVLGSDDTDDWIDRRAILYVDKSVMFAGKRVGGIRVRPASKEEVALADGKSAF